MKMARVARSLVALSCSPLLLQGWIGAALAQSVPTGTSHIAMPIPHSLNATGGFSHRTGSGAGGNLSHMTGTQTGGGWHHSDRLSHLQDWSQVQSASGFGSTFSSTAASSSGTAASGISLAVSSVNSPAPNT